ncbi:LTA synthase family protein [Rhodanobacter hydrolyticus]|uniref:LTA synthase family protein n=1 Tax=Rhodanobacter hydrolyticus TaxID=2250595 RepID=UPI00384BD3B6
MPSPTARTNPHPDIVQVLEESTFDPSIFTGCDIPQCRMPMFESDTRTRGHGLLRTHTFGGGTWVSEFAVLTGMPQDIFGPAGMYAPYVLAPRTHDTLPMLLRRLGYLTVAIYPVGGNFLNARNAYQSYGFDQFYDIHDLGLQMWHASDAQLFDATKRVYDKVRKPGQPVFIMVLTMEQHGPHDTKPLSSLPAPFNRNPIRGLPADQALNLGTYLSKLRDSDEGMHQLEHDFLDRQEPTVLMHFGDHQPSFSGLIREMQRVLPSGVEPYKHNLTYYMVKSNFTGPALPSYPMLDIAYLPSMVLQAAGLPEDPYFSALRSLRDRCDGRYGDCADKPLLASYYAWIFGQLHELK